jgi:uncharacterized OB-fold protein
MINACDIIEKSSSRVEAPRVLYGLPCAECGAYYASNLSECPVCHSGERIAAARVCGEKAAAMPLGSESL